MQRKIRFKNSLKRRFTFLHAILLLAIVLSLIHRKRGISTLPVNTITPSFESHTYDLSYPHQDETKFY